MAMRFASKAGSLERASNTSVIGVLVLLAIQTVSLAGERVDEVLSPSLSELAKSYSLRLEATQATFPVRTAQGLIEGRPTTAKQLAAYEPILVREFNRYPVTLVAAARLKRVVLCEGLRFAGQRRTAIPDFQHDTLYLDVKRGIETPRYVRAVIHHEFFHLVDYRDDGKVYQDKEWSRLNRTEFRYGPGGRSVQNNPDTSLLTEKFPGFLNHYSTSGVEEDKAELFAYLVLDHAYVLRRAKMDDVLQAKVERLKQLLKRFCPEVDTAFWQRNQKRTR